MSKTFRYTKFTGHYYCQYSDEWEEDGVEFDYEVDDDDLLRELVGLTFEEYFDKKEIRDNKETEKAVKESLKRFIDEHEIIDILADCYEDELKEIFRDEALEFYND